MGFSFASPLPGGSPQEKGSTSLVDTGTEEFIALSQTSDPKSMQYPLRIRPLLLTTPSSQNSGWVRLESTIHGPVRITIHCGLDSWELWFFYRSDVFSGWVGWPVLGSECWASPFSPNSFIWSVGLEPEGRGLGLRFPTAELSVGSKALIGATTELTGACRSFSEGLSVGEPFPDSDTALERRVQSEAAVISTGPRSLPQR